MRNKLIDLQNSDTWKIHLTIAINFISLNNAEEEHVMHSRSNNIKFISYNDVNKVVHGLFFKSLRSSYQGNLNNNERK